MSHFTCLVIGDDIEGQLQPFHEFECTGINDQHVKDIDKTEEMRAEIAKDGLQSALEYFGVDDKVVEYEAEVDREDAHKYGYAVVRDGMLVKYVDRTNPDKKWDWWTVGGRWSGFLLLRDGGRSNSARVADIDFDGMRRDHVEKELARYRQFHGIVAGRPVPRWDEVRERHERIEDARKEYWANPVIRDLTQSREFMFADGYEDFAIPEAEFIARAADEAISTFAAVKDGKWYERGRMGWFACVSDEKDKADWNHEFRGLLGGLADDTILTVVDCHI